MTPRAAQPTIGLRGLERRVEVRAGVVSLEGASAAELRRAVALARGFAKQPLLVAVDGGVRSCRSAGLRPELWIGDGDSGKKPTAMDSIELPRDKDFSDFAGALRELRRLSVDVVAVAGLLGGRLDHEWANVSEAGNHAGHFAAIAARTTRGTVIVSGRGCRIAGAGRSTVSVFALGGRATITLLGVRWPLDRAPLEPGSHGLSNVIETTLELDVHRGVVAVVLVPRRFTRRRPTAH